jgi:hypothetical protein
MTLRLAAVQHFCGRFADAVLTSWSPLTYERGDYMDGTEKLDPDYEPTTAAEWKKLLDGPCRCGMRGLHACPFIDSPVGVSTSPPIVPPTGLDPSPTIIESAPPPQVGGDGPSEEIAAFPRRPSEGHPTVPAGSAPDLPAGISLPMFKAKDLEAVAAEYIAPHLQRAERCSCTAYNYGTNHAEHVAELVVSALLFELQGLAYEQSHPQTEQ